MPTEGCSKSQLCWYVSPVRDTRRGFHLITLDSTKPGLTACGGYVFNSGSTVLRVCAATPFAINALVSLPTSSSPSTAPSSAAPSSTTAPPTSTSSSTASPTATPHAGTLSTGAVVGIVIGGSLGFVIVCLLAYHVYGRRMGYRRETGGPEYVPLGTVTQDASSGPDRTPQQNPTSHQNTVLPGASAINQNERENGFGQSTLFLA